MKLAAVRALLAALWLAVAATAAGAAQPIPADRTAPVVVELFTSHGCPYCPPADAFLGELAGEDDILALSMHVTYLNRGGFADPFSMPAATTRQAAYRQALGLRGVYTPQMVIDGMAEVIGSDRPLVRTLIDGARKRARLAIGFVRDGERLGIALPQASLAAPATVWVVLYDRRHATMVKGRGPAHERVNYNVVRTLRPLGVWDGKAITVAIALSGPALTHDGLAVIVQAGQHGPVLGATSVSLKTALGW